MRSPLSVFVLVALLSSLSSAMIYEFTTVSKNNMVPTFKFNLFKAFAHDRLEPRGSLLHSPSLALDHLTL